MAGTASRKRRLRKIADLVGNAVAHAVLYQDSYGVREALLYRGQAEAVAESATWNDLEREQFKEWAFRRATGEIRKRTGERRGPKYDRAIEEATKLVEAFVEESMM